MSAQDYYKDNEYPPQGQGQGNPYGYSNNGQQQYAPSGQQFPPRQQYYQNQQGFQLDGPTGERGVLGAIGGGLAGGVGGHAVGNKTGYSKLGSKFFPPFQTDAPPANKFPTPAVLGVVGGAIAGHKLQDGVSDWKDKRDEEKQQHQHQQQQQQQSQHHNNNNNDMKPAQLNPHGVAYAGNFSGSSRDMRLDGDYTLHASCKRIDGSYQASSINLNRLLENDQGSFRWASPRSHSPPAQQQHCHARQVTVQPGDTLRGIARQVGASFEEIARMNGIQNPDLIYPGQVLNVPGGAAPPPPAPCGGGGDVGNFGASARNVRLVDGGRRLEGELLRNGQWVGSSIVLDERIGNENGTLEYKA